MLLLQGLGLRLGRLSRALRAGWLVKELVGIVVAGGLQSLRGRTGTEKRPGTCLVLYICRSLWNLIALHTALEATAGEGT